TNALQISSAGTLSFKCIEIKARSEKRSSVITDLVYVLILLIKEKDRSASALYISNVQPTTSRKWMFGKESLSHAPKASRHLLTSLPRDLGHWRSFSHLSISLMYSSGFTDESRNKDGTRERAW
ncbi:hypothetical protein EMCRGX_G032285, partial [Ephydatia muelleri]